MTYLINQAIFILINILNAANDASKIKKHRHVDHLMNGIAYIISITVFIMIFKMDVFEIIIFSISCFCNRQLFFDITLNLMRKLKWNYVSPNPTSFIDKMEKRLFGMDGNKPNIIYALGFVISIISNLLFF